MANLKLVDFIASLAKKSGVNIEGIIEANPAFNEVELPENLSETLGIENLMTLDSAKNNSDLSKHYKGKYLASVDTVMKRQLKDVGFDQAKIDEIMNSNDSLKSLETGFGALKDFHTASANKGDDVNEDLKKYRDLVNNQHPAQIAKMQEEHKQEMENVVSGYKQKELNHAIDRSLSGYNLAEGYEMGAVSSIIKEQLKGGDFTMKMSDKGEIQLFQKEDPTLVAQIDNRPMNFKTDVLDKMAANFVKKAPTQPDNQKKNITVDKTDYSNQRIAGNSAANLAVNRAKNIKHSSGL